MGRKYCICYVHLMNWNEAHDGRRIKGAKWLSWNLRKYIFAYKKYWKFKSVQNTTNCNCCFRLAYNLECPEDYISKQQLLHAYSYANIRCWRGISWILNDTSEYFTFNFNQIFHSFLLNILRTNTTGKALNCFYLILLIFQYNE